MIRRPILVQEKVDFYVWRCRIRMAIKEYHSMCNYDVANEELIVLSKRNGWYHPFNWRNMDIAGSNVMWKQRINSIRRHIRIELPKYYYYSSGSRQLYGFNH